MREIRFMELGIIKYVNEVSRASNRDLKQGLHDTKPQCQCAARHVKHVRHVMHVGTALNKINLFDKKI
jgi:hypothetical protein